MPRFQDFASITGADHVFQLESTLHNLNLYRLGSEKPRPRISIFFWISLGDANKPLRREPLMAERISVGVLWRENSNR